MRPTIYGRPAGSLGDDAGFAASQEAAAAGVRGELQVARALEAAATSGQAVFHDLSIPGLAANIDHAVLGRNRLLLLDAKFWKPGFYWTLGGTTRRGFELVPHADKKTLGAAFDRVGRTLSGVPVTLDIPIMVIAPSSSRAPLRLWAYRPNAARAVSLARLSGAGGRRLLPQGEPNPSVLRALLPLVRTP